MDRKNMIVYGINIDPPYRDQMAVNVYLNTSNKNNEWKVFSLLSKKQHSITEMTPDLFVIELLSFIQSQNSYHVNILNFKNECLTHSNLMFIKGITDILNEKEIGFFISVETFGVSHLSEESIAYLQEGIIDKIHFRFNITSMETLEKQKDHFLLPFKTLSQIYKYAILSPMEHDFDVCESLSFGFYFNQKTYDETYYKMILMTFYKFLQKTDPKTKENIRCYIIGKGTQKIRMWNLLKDLIDPSKIILLS